MCTFCTCLSLQKCAIIETSYYSPYRNILNYQSVYTTHSATIKHMSMSLTCSLIYRDSISTLVEFSRYSDSAENNQKLEIDKIQGFVLDELIRQNDMANDTKFQCEQRLQQLQNVLEDVSYSWQFPISMQAKYSRIYLYF